jgi:hypothetical protein
MRVDQVRQLLIAYETIAGSYAPHSCHTSTSMNEQMWGVAEIVVNHEVQERNVQPTGG